MEEPEPALIRAATQGDLDAFTVLVGAYQEPVWRFLVRLVGDEGVAEDLGQETFLRAHRGLRGFRHESRFSTWIFAIARNAATDHRRGAARQDRMFRVLGATAPVDGPDTEVEVRLGLDALSPKLREALVTIEVLGLRYREAAVVLGVAEGTVKSRVFQARRELARWMSADDRGEEVEKR